MNTKNPPKEVFTKEEMSFMSTTLNEFQKRLFLGTKALSIGRGGVRIVSKCACVSKNTIYNAIREIKSNYTPAEGCIRRPDGGRKTLLSQHPEWIDVFKKVTAPFTAGLSQNNVKWISIPPSIIKDEMNKEGYKVSIYIVKQILKRLGYGRRSFIKDMPMKDVEDRDSQFRNIAMLGNKR